LDTIDVKTCVPAAIAYGLPVQKPQQYNPNEVKHFPLTQTAGGTHSVAITSAAITIPPLILPHSHKAIPARTKPTVAPFYFLNIKFF